MPFEGLREFLYFLKDRNELVRVTREINPNSYEISSILDRVKRLSGKTLIFENLKNFDVPLCANVLGSSKHVSMALETTEDQIFPEWKKTKISCWLSPTCLSEGPCHEMIVKREDIDLFRYPILKWHPYDAGPYITLGALISKDPETKQQNMGFYRLMVQGKKQLGINLLEGRHAELHLKKAEAKGHPLEVAVAIGLDPAVTLAAATDLEFGQDELAFAGSLRGEPVKVVKCKTVDVEVPASSEIVLEGEISARVRVLEGPFGESTGFYGKTHYKPVLKLKTITHREKPIFQATYTRKRPSEENFITSLNNWHCSHSTKDVRPNIFGSGCRRLKLELTAKRIRLPIKDRCKVAKDWSSYGLD